MSILVFQHLEQYNIIIGIGDDLLSIIRVIK